MMKTVILLSMVVLMLVAPVCILVNSVHATDFPEITAEQLKKKMDAGEKLLLINPLSDIEFKTEHIPGSVNIPLQDLLISQKMPKDKNHLIVTYCLGRKCIYSTDSADIIVKRGYTNIMVFRDGIPGWKKAGFTTTSAAAVSNEEVPVILPSQLHDHLNDYLVVDIRPPSVYNMGHLPESRAMPMPYLSMLSVELPKHHRIVVVDHLGKQCAKAAQWLTSNGFKDVSILKGGILSYLKAGFPLEN